MRELLKKEVTFNWTKECTTELEESKMALISKAILSPIDENNDIYLTVDGSKLGIGGHIFQKRPNGKIYVCLLFERNDKKSAELAVICLRNAGINYDFKTIRVYFIT